MGFEIYDLFGEADLTVSPDAPIPVALTTYSNPRPGTASELVVVRAGADTNSLARDWYLRVTVPGTNSLTYRVRVNIESGGILPIGSPLVIQPVIGTNGVISLLNWQAIPGEVYRVDFADSLAAPIRWNPLSTNTATTDFLSVPILGLPSAPERYLRTVQIPRIP